MRLGVVDRSNQQKLGRTLNTVNSTVSEIQAKLGHASLATTGKYLAALKRAENRHGEELARLFGFEEE